MNKFTNKIQHPEFTKFLKWRWGLHLLDFLYPVLMVESGIRILRSGQSVWLEFSEFAAMLGIVTLAVNFITNGAWPVGNFVQRHWSFEILNLIFFLIVVDVLTYTELFESNFLPHFLECTVIAGVTTMVLTFLTRGTWPR